MAYKTYSMGIARLIARPRISISRSFAASTYRAATVETPIVTQPVVTRPVRRPIGAFRGTLFGFLLGASSTGAALYYYIIDEYKLSNQLLTEDLVAVQSGLSRLEAYVQKVEGNVQQIEKRLK